MRAYAARATETAATPCEHIVLMPSKASRCVSTESLLSLESGQRSARLLNLHRSQPRSCQIEYSSDVRETFGQPLEVVGSAVAFNPSETAEGLAQSFKHFRRNRDGAVL